MQELAKALLAARKEVAATVFKAGQIKAEGNERAPKYDYVGHEHVLLHVREKMLAHGLVLVQTSVEFAGYAEWETRDGHKRILRWKGTHKLLHTSGECLEYACEATTGTNDKAAFVASTACDRTALLRLMQLAGSAKEDPEHHSNQEKEDRAPRERSSKGTPNSGKASAQTPRGAQTGAIQLDPSWAPPLFGLTPPTSPCPIFGPAATVPLRGKRWDVIEGGWLVQDWMNDRNVVAQLDAAMIEWGKHLVELRARRKAWEAAQPKAKAATPDVNAPDYLTAEQEAAERAFAQRDQAREQS